MMRNKKRMTVKRSEWKLLPVYIHFSVSYTCNINFPTRKRRVKTFCFSLDKSNTMIIWYSADWRRTATVALRAKKNGFGKCSEREKKFRRKKRMWFNLLDGTFEAVNLEREPRYNSGIARVGHRWSRGIEFSNGNQLQLRRNFCNSRDASCSYVAAAISRCKRSAAHAAIRPSSPVIKYETN